MPLPEDKEFPQSVVDLLNQEISCVGNARGARYANQQLFRQKIEREQSEIDKLNQYERELIQTLKFHEALINAKP